MRQRISIVYLSIKHLTNAYYHNSRLHKTVQTEIAKKLKFEKYRVYVCSFNEAYFHMLTIAIQ